MPASSMSSNGWSGFVALLPLFLILCIYLVVCLWRIFVKAGRPGWAAIVPFYNSYTMIKVAGRPGWWLVLLFIPLVNIVIWIIIFIDLGKAFGKSIPFSIFWIILFGIVGYSILAFGKSQYMLGEGSGASTDTTGSVPPTPPAAPMPPSTPTPPTAPMPPTA